MWEKTPPPSEIQFVRGNSNSHRSRVEVCVCSVGEGIKGEGRMQKTYRRGYLEKLKKGRSPIIKSLVCTAGFRKVTLT